MARTKKDETTMKITVAARMRRYVTTVCQAGDQPWRKAWLRLVTKVGTIRPARASSGGRKAEKPEIMIIGMAKPTAPLTKPASRVTAAAIRKCPRSSPATPAPLFAARP